VTIVLNTFKSLSIFRENFSRADDPCIAALMGRFSPSFERRMEDADGGAGNRREFHDSQMFVGSNH